MIIKIDKEKFVQIDENDRAEVINKKNLEREVAELEARIGTAPKATDEQLLEWAKKNYIDHSEEEKQLEKCQSILTEINKL